MSTDRELGTAQHTGFTLTQLSAAVAALLEEADVAEGAL